MDILLKISQFIDKNVFQSKCWDLANDVQRQKAVNNSIRILQAYLPDIYSDDIPIDHLAEQVIWYMKIDDTFQRSELGAKSMSVDGFSISVDSKDRSIAPYVLRVNNIAVDPKTGSMIVRKIGRYSRPSNTKRGIY